MDGRSGWKGVRAGRIEVASIGLGRFSLFCRECGLCHRLPVGRESCSTLAHSDLSLPSVVFVRPESPPLPPLLYQRPLLLISPSSCYVSSVSSPFSSHRSLKTPQDAPSKETARHAWSWTKNPPIFKPQPSSVLYCTSRSLI